jgi:hypothetical protein
LELSEGTGSGDTIEVRPGQVAEAMNKIAVCEDLAEPEKPFTNARRVGWLLKRQRFRRARNRNEEGKVWETTRQEIEAAARPYGVVEPQADGSEKDTDEPEQDSTEKWGPF